jgi:hypothetical protein
MFTLFAKTHYPPQASAPFIGSEALRLCPAAKWLVSGAALVVGADGNGQDSRSMGGPSS